MTTKFVDVFPECLVEAVSWGSYDTTSLNGYIALNGTRVVNTTSSTYKAFNLVELNTVSCSSSNILHFDTSSSTAASDNMATYINGLPLNTVLIGVTADDAQLSLNQNATSALFAIGVNVNGLAFRGKVSFVAQIGQPGMTVSNVAALGGSSLKIAVSVTGMSYK